MRNSVQVIEELSGVHEAIRHYAIEIKDNIVNLETLSSQCTGEWSSNQCQIITVKQFNLKQNLQYLEKGLHDHYLKENELLKPLIGELLMKAVSRECQEINTQFEQAKLLLVDIDQGLPTAKDLMTQTAEARQVVETFSHLIQRHSQNMDTLLQMLKSVI